jgi:arginine utilization protein RocB
MAKWQTKVEWRQLLADLVRIPSVTGSEAENTLVQVVHQQLQTLPYFVQHPEHLRLSSTGDGRHLLTALVRAKPETAATVVLLSHFDVVAVDDYGVWQSHAFDMERLTELLRREATLPPEVRAELEEERWVCGRGTMDMKCGLAVHLALLERASMGQFPGNLLLLTVPDEEGNSAGMRAAVPVLTALAEEFWLDYRAVVNSEPVFSSPPGDRSQVVYTGSVGKVLPGFLCCGKETHVGEPFSGLGANLLASALTCELELNTQLCETVTGECTPPPTTLWQGDMKQQYSVKLPHRAIVYYNLFLLERSGADVVDVLRRLAERAARRVEDAYRREAARYFAATGSVVPAPGSIRVITYRELWQYAVETYGFAQVEAALAATAQATPEDADERWQSACQVDALADLCQELAPMLVLFFAPPFYPAVSSSGDPVVERIVQETAAYAKAKHNVQLQRRHFFNGISDLSYVGLRQPMAAVRLLVDNMPLWQRGYTLPLADMEKLNVPVLNLGPLGRDAHQFTERLDIESAYDVTLDLLHYCVLRLLENAAAND